MILKFRRTCGDCGHVFFTPDRAAKFCPSCVQLIEAAEKQKKRALEKVAKKKIPPKPPSRPAVPALQPVTGETRQKILKEFELLQDEKELPRSKIHGRIAGALHLKKMVVAQVLQGLYEESKLRPGAKEEILDRYQKYVENLERPSEGRRQVIAAKVEVPFQHVTRIVRKWRASKPKLKDLTREQRFQIEKVFFQNLEKGKSFTVIMREALKAGKCDPWLVFSYLDFIHDGVNRLEKIPDVTAEQKKKILAGYGEYLSAPAPPDGFLHDLLAEKAGVTHKQVHKTVLCYRLDRLGEIQSRGKKGKGKS